MGWSSGAAVPVSWASRARATNHPERARISCDRALASARLSSQQVDDRADPLLVASEGHALRLLGAREEVATGPGRAASRSGRSSSSSTPARITCCSRVSAWARATPASCPGLPDVVAVLEAGEEGKRQQQPRRPEVLVVDDRRRGCSRPGWRRPKARASAGPRSAPPGRARPPSPPAPVRPRGRAGAPARWRSAARPRRCRARAAPRRGASRRRRGCSRAGPWRWQARRAARAPVPRTSGGEPRLRERRPRLQHVGDRTHAGVVAYGRGLEGCLGRS